jgi:squalene synthase HpnD
MTAIATSDAQPAAQRAAGSSFYAAKRIMPRSQREAMFEIYSFCRMVDDIADSLGPRDERLAQLEKWSDDIKAICSGATPAHREGLAKAVQKFNLQQEDFLAVIDGMAMDVLTDIQAPTFATLDLYCDRVASAVGRLSVRVFGMPHDDGIALAHHLGRALQLTNILRDLDEDAVMNRLYLPEDTLLGVGITATHPADVLAAPLIHKACTIVVARARQHFSRAQAIMDRSPRRTVRAPRIMGAAYSMILDRLVARGWQAPREPVKLRKMQLIPIVLRYAIL